MGTINVTIAPDDQSLPVRLDEAVRAGLDEAGRFLVDMIVSNISGPGPSAPGDYPASDSGELASSISYRVEEGRLIVSASAPHAAALEFGDRPFLSRTLRENEAEVYAIIERSIAAELGAS